MKIITFFNNKGGVGKTTLAVNMAAFFSKHLNKRILFLDIDPQANSTQMIIPEEIWEDFYGSSATRPTIINYLSSIQEGDSNVDLNHPPFPHTENRFCIDLIPGHPRLSIIEDILSDSWNKCTSGDLGGFRKTNWLKSLQMHYQANYDFMFIDVGPSLGALNRSVLLNSDFIVTPMGSDIFSLIGISNISLWIDNWVHTYRTSLINLNAKHENSAISKFHLNLNPDQTTRFIGFSIQQYLTKSFKTGRRPVASFERIIQQIPQAILENLNFLIFNGLTLDNLNLGDIPYLYSLVPLAQSAKTPMFDLKYPDGLVGSQTSSVKKYTTMLNTIATKLLHNMGEI